MKVDTAFISRRTERQSSNFAPRIVLDFNRNLKKLMWIVDISRALAISSKVATCEYTFEFEVSRLYFLA